MEFTEISVCQSLPTLNFSPVDIEIIDAEISKHLSKIVVVNTTREPNDYVSRIFTSTKKSGTYRIILKLKTFMNFLNLSTAT